MFEKAEHKVYRDRFALTFVYLCLTFFDGHRISFSKKEREKRMTKQRERRSRKLE